MSRIIQSSIGGLNWTFPHTGYRRVIEGATKTPTPARSDAAVLFMPIIAPKGETDVLTTFDGDYADFVAEYGEYDAMKQGLPFKLVHDHIAAGGRWVGMNLRAEDATAANVAICLTVTPVTKNFYVAATGEIFSKKPTDVETKTVTINTYSFGTSFVNMQNITTLEGMDLALKAITAKTNPNAVVLPMFSFLYRGRGKYGNNIEMGIEKSSSILKTSTGNYSIYHLTILDKLTKTVLDVVPFTHGLDVFDGNGSPLNLVAGMEEFGSPLKQRLYQDNMHDFDDIFEIMLQNILDQLKVLKDAETDPMTELEDIYTVISDIRTTYTENNNTIPAINLIDPFGTLAVDSDENEEIWTSLFNMPEDKIYTFNMAYGDDGYMKKMKRFDWDFETTVGESAGVKAISRLYKYFFQGSITKDIYDRILNRSDYIIDIGFPLEVKLAACNFTSDVNRPDILFFMNAPISLTTVDELKVFDKSYTTDNINVFKYAQSGNVKDVSTNKWLKVPVTVTLDTLLINFFSKAMESIASKYIRSFQDNSVFPRMTVPKEMEWCTTHDWNYLVPTVDGYRIDGSLSAYYGYDHPAKEAHNQLLTGRLIKDALDYLDAHNFSFQNKPLSDIKDGMEKEVLDKYRGLGLTCSYSVYYANERDRKAGILTDELLTEGPRTNKRHNLIHRLTNKQ